MNGMEAGHSDIDVSIVIVNYRVKYFLEQTVRSAKEALAGFSGEIIVVDNNSGDDSIEHLRKCFPDVIVIENRENAGFGRANNQGFAIARGKFTLILNPDTIIGSHTGVVLQNFRTVVAVSEIAAVCQISFALSALRPSASCRHPQRCVYFHTHRSAAQHWRI